MATIVKLISMIAFASLASSRSTPAPASVVSRDEIAPPESFDSYLLYRPQLPVTLELPRAEQNLVPFAAALQQPSAVLRAPVEALQPNYYLSPVPSQDLVAPVETAWNPSNDPKLYYEVPAVLTKQELPTKEFPKKYNDEIHLKKKPYSNRPKQMLVLEPINEEQYEVKQKDLQKTFQKLAKKENQKHIQVSNIKKPKFKEPVSAGSGYSTSENFQSPPQTFINPPQDFGLESHNTNEPSASESFNQGLSAELTASLGIPTDQASAGHGGDRLSFHMAGHDGPDSYKWGFDTGKGHNRQFRFEERDKAGLVKGHYGYYDKEGKLRVVHYDADPHKGFHSEGNFDNKS